MQASKENQINVFELSLLLKVMGFRLNYLNYEEANSSSANQSSDITIEIKCGKQNIISRLSATEELCGCPAKKEERDNDSSFWEILGTAPSSSPGKQRIEDTCSNLLPELSKRGVTNTKQLLSLIFDGFHKDHLPSAVDSRTTNNSPERTEIPLNPIHTSTQIRSPRRVIPVLNPDMLLQEEVDKFSPGVLTAPPNTPKVNAGGAGFGGKLSSLPNIGMRHRDHLVYLEVMAAKERLDKALLSMKMNIAGEFTSLHGPAMDLSAHKIFEEEGPSPGVSPATFKRRSSMGSFPNLKSKAEAADKKKTTLVRNKSSIDTGAAFKAKTGAVTSRYLQPKKTVEVKKVSPGGRKTALSTTKNASTAKRSPVVGSGTWK